MSELTPILFEIERSHLAARNYALKQLENEFKHWVAHLNAIDSEISLFEMLDKGSVYTQLNHSNTFSHVSHNLHRVFDLVYKNSGNHIISSQIWKDAVTEFPKMEPVLMSVYEKWIEKL